MNRRYQCRSNHQLRLLGGLLLLILLLTNCTPALTYTDTVSTAIVAGCWPDTFPTPRGVTVTLQWVSRETPIPETALPETPLPTTTPYLRCPPPAGATQQPWPAAVPPAPTYPTIEPRSWVGGSWRQTTLLLPTKVLTIDIATHPSEDWPAVASVVWSGNEDPDRVMVSVYNPQTHGWSSARQVDLGASRIGRYSRSVAIAITGDRQVHVVWGMSDPDFATNDPPSGIWTATSSDFGQSWSAPQRIATGCRRVNSLAATPEGVLVAQLICDAGPRAAQLTMVERSADGLWHAPERLAILVWPYSEGRVVLTGTGGEATAVSLVLAGTSSEPIAYVARKRLAGGEWQLSQRPLNLPAPSGSRMWQVSGLAYTRVREGSSTPAITFTFTSADATQGVYALTSLDGGSTWGAVETIDIRAAAMTLFAAPAYDPLADRLVTFFTCCADASWEWVESSHYARWSVPGSGNWQTSGGEDPHQLVPLAISSRAAAQTVTAQAPGSRMIWIAWIDTLQRVEVRSVALNQLIPADQYPIESR